MSGEISTELETALKVLSNSDLVDFEVRDGGSMIRLTFSFAGFAGGEGVEWVVCLYRVAELRYVRLEPDNESYLVLGASVQVEGNGYCRFVLSGELELEAVCRDVHDIKVLKPLSEIATAPNKPAVAAG